MSTAARTSSENITYIAFLLSFFDYSKSHRYESVSLTRMELNLCERFGDKKKQLKIFPHVLTSSTQLQSKSFHVMERTRTSAKCTKMNIAPVKRGKVMFFNVKNVSL